MRRSMNPDEMRKAGVWPKSSVRDLVHPAPEPPRNSWSLRHPDGFGVTRRERIAIDLAKVIRAHGLDEEQHTDAPVLAGYLIDVLEARKGSL
jgi:hypothetical protein